MVRIFVGNLGTHYNESVLRSVFETYGRVEEVSVTSTYALVVMANSVEADRAIRGLSSTSWFLRSVTVAPPAVRTAA